MHLVRNMGDRYRVPGRRQQVPASHMYQVLTNLVHISQSCPPLGQISDKSDLYRSSNQ